MGIIKNERKQIGRPVEKGWCVHQNHHQHQGGVSYQPTDGGRKYEEKLKDG